VFNRYAVLDTAAFLFFTRPPSNLKAPMPVEMLFRKMQRAIIFFFDSDDLMTRNHLEIKLNAMKKVYNQDYIITRTKISFNKDTTNRHILSI
jgi:hypothetical protein